jgi:ABC-type dipeptide/oligopeptide/nickel transport system ATPase subunit
MINNVGKTINLRKIYAKDNSGAKVRTLEALSLKISSGLVCGLLERSGGSKLALVDSLAGLMIRTSR